MANSVEPDQEQSDPCLPRPACPKTYRNFPKFSDRQVWANSADPDQEQSDQGVHCLPFCIAFRLITLWQSHIVQILE